MILESNFPLAIGMLHVPALPGSPLYSGNLDAIRALVLSDADKLIRAGFSALMLENFGDIPFYPGRVPHETAAAMTMLAVAVKSAFPHAILGINILRNDGLTALAVAQASSADFIRVNVLCGARVTDQGILQGIAHDLLRLRKNLSAGDIRIFADVDVKHSSPVGPSRPIEVEVEDLVTRGLADALIVSGTGTGKATDTTKLAFVIAAAQGLSRKVPVLVGSGVRAESLAELAKADGFIVGTSLKLPGTGPGGPIDEAKAAQFIAALKELRA